MATELPFGINFPQIMSVDQVPAGEFAGGHKVEAIVKSEIPAYRHLLLAAIQELPYASEPGKKENIEKRTPAYFAEALSKPEEWTLLAAKSPEDAIIGVLEARITLVGGVRTGFVHWIAVDQLHRRQGVAESLYTEYEAQMRTRMDVPYLMAHVHDENIPSLRLHCKMGISQIFAERPDGRGKWYYKPIGTK